MPVFFEINSRVINGHPIANEGCLRLLKLARGGRAARLEAQRMVTEKGVAFAEAAAMLATGGSVKKVVRRVRSRVSQTSGGCRAPARGFAPEGMTVDAS